MMTANPNWPELVALSQLGHFTEHERRTRVDLITRVFHANLEILKEHVLEKQILGKVVGHVLVIEWQKRGLPHCHMLLWMADRDRVDTPEQIDEVISARVPDPERFPRYFNLVKDMMCHGPCDHAT